MSKKSKESLPRDPLENVQHSWITKGIQASGTKSKADAAKKDPATIQPAKRVSKMPAEKKRSRHVSLLMSEELFSKLSQEMTAAGEWSMNDYILQLLQDKWKERQ